jgi:hypothetical protein
VDELPPEVSSYFDVQQLTDLYAGLESPTNYYVGAKLNPEELQLTFMLRDVEAADFGATFAPDTSRIPIEVPTRYLSPLKQWFDASYESMPPGLQQRVDTRQVGYYAFFERGEHLLLFTGAPADDGGLRIVEPIISMDPEFGEIPIWPREGTEDDLAEYIADGVYPLDPPWHPETGERNTSWLLHSFFETPHGEQPSSE